MIDIVVCFSCHVVIREQPAPPGSPTGGVSHGLCDACLADRTAE